MRYTHLLLHALPSDAELVKPTPWPSSTPTPRLPTSQHHRLRKTSVSTGGSSFSSVDKPRTATAAAAAQPSHKPALPRLQAWESYLHWLCLTEEPGTLWSSALCAVFRAVLASDAAHPADCAARIDDIYWGLYLPVDPLLQFVEDRILSGYLLHVWTMFIELGRRIAHDDAAQDRLVALLKALVRLPPMEVRTWHGNDAPWSDLPTLDDALVAAWDDLYDPEIRMAGPEGHWVNYFAFLGRLVDARVTPDWWEIPGITLREVLAEDIQPNSLTRLKTMALAEFMNYAGDAFFEWCIESGTLDVDRNMSFISPLMHSPIQRDWWESANGHGG